MNVKVFWKCKRSDAYDAKGVFDGIGLTVLTGSKINPLVSTTETNRNKYYSYIDSDFILTKDVFFKSPSAAAKFVSGRSANGWVEWKDENGNALEKHRNGGQPESICEKQLDENPVVLTTNNDYKKVKRAKTPEEKLIKKIKKSFDKVKYIGDIPIDDQEYDILVEILRKRIFSMNASFATVDDPIFAVALVQIGIRFYNGKFWSHVSDIVGIKLDGNKQGKIGSRFYNTLIKHKKIHLGENEMVNNILMHCFITKYYASDFFDFLFAYYQYDLDRDLEQHKEMRDHLISCMKKAEDSSRAFKVKKGTADAATVNEKGCKIRVYNILKWMDAYLFEDRLPENSPNRTAQFFVEWAKTSKRFSKEKGIYYSRGKKRFRSPYLHFDFKTEEFQLVLPVQTIPLSDNEESAELSWKISYESIEEIIESETENTVIGCRNINIEYLTINPDYIFSNFKIELIKNKTDIIKRFALKSDSARFFDSDYDNIVGTHLPEGDVYTFVQRDEKIESDAYYDLEHYLGLDFYSFNLSKGNIVKKPDGKALSVGRELQEGLLEHNYISYAKAIMSDYTLDIYSKAPSVLVKMKKTAQVGTLIIVNGIKNRFNLEKCIEFKQDSTEYNYYLINLTHYCNSDGAYTIEIDVPSDRKLRRYEFVLIENYGCTFEGAPYIFMDKGRIRFNENLSVLFRNQKANTFDFDIDGNTDVLDFVVNGFKILIEVPVFKWKLRCDGRWHHYEPDELWHKEFPDNMCFKIPSNSGRIYSDQDIIDDEDGQSIDFTYDQENNCFVCDTRKIKTWLEMGTAIHNLYIQFGETDFKFLTVVTNCILADCQLSSSLKDGQLNIQSTILGFFDCFVDIYHNEELIAEKINLTSNGAKHKTDKLFGAFKLVFFEYDDDGDDFGDAVYSEFATKRVVLNNENSLIGKKVTIQYATEDSTTQSIFSASKFDIRDRITILIDEIDKDDPTIYYGTSNCPNPTLSKLRMEVDLLDVEKPTKAIVLFYDKEEMCYVDFVYDKKLKTVLKSEDDSLSIDERKARYMIVTQPKYYYITVSK